MNKTPDARRGATKHDIVVGGRIRARRLALGMPQVTLATALGVSFQQIQKYEKGSNRLSGARLVKAAEALKLDVAWLLVGNEEKQSPDAELIDRFFASKEGTALAQVFIKLDIRSKRAVVELAKSIVKRDG